MLRVRGRRLAAIRIGAAALLLAGLVDCGSGGPHNAPTSIVVEDFTGVGTPSVAFSAALVSGKGNAAAYPGLVSILLNDHSKLGTFANGVHYATGNNSTGMAAGYLTGPAGGIDLVVANYTAGTISVLLQDGTNTGKFQAADTITVGGSPHEIAIGDVNGDGKLDIVVADRTNGAGRVVILLQDPSNPGHFLAPTSLAVGNAVSSVAVADLNKDGFTDIIAANADTGGNNGQVTVFYQNPAKKGTFLTPVVVPAGAQPTVVKVVDLNGDGLLDLVVGNLGPGTDGFGVPGMTVLLQNPKEIGSFETPGITYQGLSGVINLAVGDINKDGIPDVVTVNLGSPTGSVSIFLGDATTRGALVTGNVYGGLSQISDAVIADVNGDGHPDLVLADGLGASVLYQIATQPANFNPAVQICTEC